MYLKDLLKNGGSYSSDGISIFHNCLEFEIREENVTWHCDTWPPRSERWPINELTLKGWTYTLAEDGTETFVTDDATIKVPPACRKVTTEESIRARMWTTYAS